LAGVTFGEPAFIDADHHDKKTIDEITGASSRNSDWIAVPEDAALVTTSMPKPAGVFGRASPL
jgi:hypothetical protein